MLEDIPTFINGDGIDGGVYGSLGLVKFLGGHR
jgi:hypothetical protein